MVKDTTVTEFLENEYSNSALYMNYRSNPSYIDGLKNSEWSIDVDTYTYSSLSKYYQEEEYTCELNN